MPLTEPTKLTLAKGQPVPNDPNFAFTSLLLHGDGVNGSTTITDSSPTPKTITVVGNAQISTAQSKFGGASIAFDGTGDVLTSPNATAFDFAAENFTVELWVYPTSSTGFRLLYAKRTLPATAQTNIAIGINAGVASFWASSNNSTWGIAHGATFGSVSNNAWSHIAVVRNGVSFTGYLNGVGTGLATSSSSVGNTASILSIGGDANGTSSLLGYIDDLRITKSIARYTTNFTPPTAPFPDF